MADVKTEASKLKDKMGADVDSFKNEVKDSMMKW